jgi:DNA-binding PadR family transcriptional regulator
MTNAELAILSLVAQHPRHGYEIEQIIEQRGMREWTEVGFSSIYYLLKKLEQKGYVKAQLVAAERGPARKVHHITPEGEMALDEGALDALSVPRRCFHQFLLGLAIMPRIEQKSALDSLGEYLTALHERRESMQASLERQQPLPYFVEAMFDYSLTLINAEVGWVEGFMQQLDSYDEDMYSSMEADDDEN